MPGSGGASREPGGGPAREPGRGRPARLPLPSTVACDQCSGSMHRRDRLFVCDRCGWTLTVASVAKRQPDPDLTEG